jgi:hypothetical protein
MYLSGPRQRRACDGRPRSVVETDLLEGVLKKFGASRRTVSVLASLAVIVSLFSVPAIAKKGQGKGNGPKGKMTVESFDPTTRVLVATTKKGATVSATVAADAKIYVIQRGSQGDRKPGRSEGTIDDIVAGRRIVNMKIRDGEVVRLALFLPKDQPCPETPTDPTQTSTAVVPMECDEDDDGPDDGTGEETPPTPL